MTHLHRHRSRTNLRRPVSKLRRGGSSVRRTTIENEISPRQGYVAFLVAFFVAVSACTAVASVCLIFQPLS